MVCLDMVNHSQPILGWHGTVRGFTNGPFEARGRAMICDGAPLVAAKAAPVTPACSGPVTLVKDGGHERYATVAGIDGHHVLVDWEGLLHLFSRERGRCIESANGIMKGWRIHPDELPRFQAKAAQCGM